MLKWETRQKWGAAPPKNRRHDVDPQGVVVHYPGGGRYTGVPHSDCQARMRMWQRMHMTRGSNDIEYGLVLCEHLHLMEARIERDRPKVRVGSNGTATANRTNSSIQLMRGSNDPPPTDDEIDAIAEAIVWLRKYGGWGPKITGHRDHVSTACPGGPLYSKLDAIRRKVKRIERGMEEKDVSRVVIKRSEPQTIELNRWVKADFRTGKGEDKVTPPNGNNDWESYINLDLSSLGGAERNDLRYIVGRWARHDADSNDLIDMEGREVDVTGADTKAIPLDLPRKYWRGTWTHGFVGHDDVPVSFWVYIGSMNDGTVISPLRIFKVDDES